MVTLNKLIQMWEKSCKLSLVEIFLLLLQCLWTITHNIGGYELTIWHSVLHITWMQFSINSNLPQPNMHVNIYSVFCILTSQTQYVPGVNMLIVFEQERRKKCCFSFLKQRMPGICFSICACIDLHIL